MIIYVANWSDYFSKLKKLTLFNEGNTQQSCDWQTRGPRIPNQIGI